MTSAEFLYNRVEALTEIAGIERDIEAFVQQTGTRHADDVRELHERLQEAARQIAGQLAEWATTAPDSPTLH